MTEQGLNTVIDTSEANAKRVQGAVLASAAHLATQRFQGWANPIVASCKDASDMIAAQQAEISTLRAQLEKAREVRPLEWGDDDYIAKPEPYQIWDDNGGSGAPDDPYYKYKNYGVFEPILMGFLGEFETIDEAKAAAQADYQRRYNAMSQEGE